MTKRLNDAIDSAERDPSIEVRIDGKCLVHIGNECFWICNYPYSYGEVVEGEWKFYENGESLFLPELGFGQAIYLPNRYTRLRLYRFLKARDMKGEK